MLLNALLCALCTSTLHIQTSMHSLVASSIFSRVVTSLNISLFMPSSFRPVMNCSINNISGSLYLFSATFVHSLPIHSWSDSLFFPHSFWYFNASMMWLWHDLNVLLSTENSPFVALHFSFSSCVNVCMSNRPSQPSQFF